MHIEWSQRARVDLREIKEHIAKDSPYYARNFTERVILAVEKLTDHPNIGRVVPEAERKDVRELIYQGYRIVYLHQPKQLKIIAVFHGNRDLASMPLKPWDVV